jgi:hypothetical protein
MAKRKVNLSIPEVAAVLPPRKSKLLPNPVIPTQDKRHMSFIRYGRISFEVFDRKVVAKIPLDLDVREEQDADLKLPQGSLEGVQEDDQALRGEEGQGDLLRHGKQARQGKDEKRKGKERVQKEAQAPLSKKQQAKLVK